MPGTSCPRCKLLPRHVFPTSFLRTVAAGASCVTPRLASSLREFAYADVKLTGGPLKRQYDWVHAHFLSLDNDRLLKVYRQRAGLPAPGDDMGGWYDADGFVPGHTIGQYISGLSRMYATTHDPATLAKVKQLVAGLCRDARPQWLSVRQREGRGHLALLHPR